MKNYIIEIAGRHREIELPVEVLTMKPFHGVYIAIHDIFNVGWIKSFEGSARDCLLQQ